MKTCNLFALLLCLSFGLSAKTTSIINPCYEFKTTGIMNIGKIELTDTATFFTINCTFIPKWWVMFSNERVIRDSETGQEYKIKNIIGATFNERLWMPESGDSAVALVFPPLPETVKKIDFDQIFGISLDPNKAGTRSPAALLPEVKNWMDAQLAKAKAEPLVDFQSPAFFNDEPARLIGCIKGYDPRAGFSTGIVYSSNEFTRNDFPVVAQILPDGRFEVEIPMNTPKYSYVVFNDQYLFRFYIEPGQTLAMTLDWEEFLIADRKRNIRYKFKQIEFAGPLTSMNEELLAYESPEPDYNSLQEKRKTMTPADFKAEQENALETNRVKFEEHLKNNPLSKKTKTILYNSLVLSNASYLFDFLMNRDYYARQDTANAILKLPVDNTYYDFLKKIDLNDQSLLTTWEFSTFINRFEYCSMFSKANKLVEEKREQQKISPEKTMLEFFIENKIELTELEIEYLKITGKEQMTDEEKAAFKKMNIARDFNSRHKDLIQQYAETYLAPLYKKQAENREQDIWKAKDSILVGDMGLKPSLVYEIAKVRSLKFFFTNHPKEKALELWNFLKSGIQTAYLVQTGDRLLNQSFPESAAMATPLPEGIGADIFRKLIEPFKGKLLFIDFWATTCGPCISGMKNMKPLREKFAGNPDFDFVFITDERSSPEKQYNEVVKEQGLTNVYRIPKDDFNHLRQLFKFNGIPRYVVIDPQGRVIDGDFGLYANSFESKLDKLLPGYKK